MRCNSNQPEPDLITSTIQWQRAGGVLVVHCAAGMSGMGRGPLTVAGRHPTAGTGPGLQQRGRD
jgi:hypothetical protein